MKNIEIVDGALNSRFEIYTVTADIFEHLFSRRQDEVYLEDLSDALQEDVAFWDQVYCTVIKPPICTRHSWHIAYPSASQDFYLRRNISNLNFKRSIKETGIVSLDTIPVLFHIP